MKLYIASLIALFTTAMAIGYSKPELKIELTKTNHTTIIGEVDPATLSPAIEAIRKSDKTKPFYLYINSGGGSVFAGLQFIQQLEA